MNSFYRSFSIGGVGVLRSKNLKQLKLIESDSYQMLQELAIRHGASSENMNAQIGQDLFVLFTLLWKRGGYFVEFGATNGIDLSNTYLLEKDFDWGGILAEPAKVWHKDLKLNRTATLDFDCVWKETGQTLQFQVTPDAEFSTLSEFKDSDAHSKERRDGTMQSVKTISLNDLLKRHNAPRLIDYLSIDTEGSEYEILKHFDFESYDVSVITCEHNFSTNRDKVKNLLIKKGFVRVYEGFSRWDDWFVNQRCIST